MSEEQLSFDPVRGLPLMDFHDNTGFRIVLDRIETDQPGSPGYMVITSYNKAFPLRFKTLQEAQDTYMRLLVENM